MKSRNRSFYARVWGCMILLGAGPVALVAAVQTTPQFYEESVRPLLKTYCLDCHSTEKQKGELDLERFSGLGQVKLDPKVWQRMLDQLQHGEMPPEEKPQLSPAEKRRLMDWGQAVLRDISLAQAGDPGPVLLRRLSNAEYTYTLQDLTGVPSLDPAREFPVDGAAGEGFMNTGNALVMSPSLFTKYLDAAKDLARHAVLVPDGIRFSSGVSRRDWTDEYMKQITELYSTYADGEGRIPLLQYVTALAENRGGLASGDLSARELARRKGLNGKYLSGLWSMLQNTPSSPVLHELWNRWRDPDAMSPSALVEFIKQWQEALSQFQNVGHMKRWVKEINPVVARRETRFKLPDKVEGDTVTIYLHTTDAGDGPNHDFMIWERPRLTAPGRPDLLLKDIRQVVNARMQLQQDMLATVPQALAAVAEADHSGDPVDVDSLARKHRLDPELLQAWLGYLGVGEIGPVRIEGYFTNTMTSGGGYDFIKSWGSPETPSLVANASDRHVRIPGNMRPHSVAVHPSPVLNAIVGWRCPEAMTVLVHARITHAHPECGNGVTWSLEHRRGTSRQQLASGISQGGGEVMSGDIPALSLRQGDLISLLIGPRDGNHSCDLTDVDLTLSETQAEKRTWNLARDVSGDVLAGNPHDDGQGNRQVWHFYTEPVGANPAGGPLVPAGSVLAHWQEEVDPEARRTRAVQLQRLLVDGPGPDAVAPDRELYRQLNSLSGPLLAQISGSPDLVKASVDLAEDGGWGLDPRLFGRHPDGTSIEESSLCVQGPSSLAVKLPADLVTGMEWVSTAVLHPGTGREGSVQVDVTDRPEPKVPGLNPELPVLVQAGSSAETRMEKAFEEFRRWFPVIVCYPRIVPVDEVITLTLFHREDESLSRLMLDEDEAMRLDRLWDELRYVSLDALVTVDAFAQLWQYATQDSDPGLIEPFRKPINERAAAFRRRLVDTQPRHVEALLKFAARAYRRPLGEEETSQLTGLYKQLRKDEMPHEEAVRMTLARVLTAPAFLYKIETPRPGADPSPVSDWELATRLSYFLWSSAPDESLRSATVSGRLGEDEILVSQARRMLRDDRVRRLAIEFACQWLHIRGFDELDEKSERHFPEFKTMRGAMYEESIRFFTDLLARDGSILEILDADHAFLNGALARYYQVPGVEGEDWKRVEGMKSYGRGGILGQATTLARQSGASRTSPILRGNWIYEVLLGERLPKPPPGVPQLPDDEAALEGLTVRQLVEKHTSDPKCMKCHQHVDYFGYALEQYDAIGRRRELDLGGRPIDTRVQARDGGAFEGLEGLRNYLLNERRDAFVHQFCRKLLGYALGREVMLSDEPLLGSVLKALEQEQYRVGAAIEMIVKSRQFREIRGRDWAGLE